MAAALSGRSLPVPCSCFPAAPAKPLELTSALPPDTGFALALGLARPEQLWKHITESIDHVGLLEGQPGLRSKMLARFEKQTAISPGRDIAPNLAELAYIVPALEDDNDLERRFAFTT